MTLFPEGYCVAATAILRHRQDSPACVPGHRASVAFELGLNPELDLTDVEHFASNRAHAEFTALEHRQLEQRPIK